MAAQPYLQARAQRALYTRPELISGTILVRSGFAVELGIEKRLP